MQTHIRHITLSELAEQHGLTCRGDASTIITGVGTLADATSAQISFLSNPAYREHLKTTRAGAVIVSKKDLEDCPVNALIADDPYVSYAKIAVQFDPRRVYEPGIHTSAAVDPGASIGKDVYVGANAVIGPGCHIGDACAIGPGSVLVADVRIGNGTRIHANVTLGEGVVIGQRSIIHSGAVIGSDGFGLAFDKDHWVKIPQIGSVKIGNDCEVGANTAIDRGAIGDTIIEDDVRLDNQIQIGHNVHIGAHTAMAGMVGISGSTKIGRYCMFAGASATVGHITIADRTTVSFLSVVTKSITQPGTTWSAAVPAQPIMEWNRTVINLRKLGKLTRRVLNLEKQTRKQAKND